MSRVTITAYSEPQYGTFSSNWSCEDWVRYHKALVEEFGKEEGDSRWVNAFERKGSFEIFADRANCISMNTSSREYFQKVGLYDRVATGLSGIVHDATGTIVSGTRTTFEATENVIDGAGNALKMTKYLIPIVVIVILAIAYKVSLSKLGLNA